MDELGFSREEVLSHLQAIPATPTGGKPASATPEEACSLFEKLYPKHVFPREKLKKLPPYLTEGEWKFLFYSYHDKIPTLQEKIRHFLKDKNLPMAALYARLFLLYPRYMTTEEGMKQHLNNTKPAKCKRCGGYFQRVRKKQKFCHGCSKLIHYEKLDRLPTTYVILQVLLNPTAEECGFIAFNFSNMMVQLSCPFGFAGQVWYEADSFFLNPQ